MVDEAVRLADEVGLSQLTLAALAKRLGVRQPSLYKHVDGMDALQRDIALRAKHELADVLARVAVGRSRGEAITCMSLAYRSWAREHPGRYAAVQRPATPGDAEAEAADRAVVQIVFDVLAGYELPRRRCRRRDPRPAGRSARLRDAGTGRWLRTPRRCRPQLRPARPRARVGVLGMGQGSPEVSDSHVTAGSSGSRRAVLHGHAGGLVDLIGTEQHGRVDDGAAPG